MFDNNSQLSLIDDWDYQEHYQLLFDPLSYHDSEAKFGSFSFLMMERGTVQYKSEEQTQWSFPLNQLADRIPEFVERARIEKKELYISQSSFSRFNRRKANWMATGCIFLDIDCYHYPTFETYSKEEVADLIIQRCEDLNLPKPSVIIDSGGGLYAKWFIDKVGKYALAYWQQVEQHLCEVFSDFGADRKALDPSRVLRVVGSDNNKQEHNPRLCKIIYINFVNGQVFRTKLIDIGAHILPQTLEEQQAYIARINAQRKEYAKKGRELNKQRIVWQAMKDLRDGGFWPQINSAKDLQKYIAANCEAYGIKLIPMPIVQPQYDIWMKNQAKFDKENKKSGGKLIKATSKFKLLKRNWRSYQDIVSLMEHRYGTDGAPSGIRNEAIWIAANQFALSEWNRKTHEQLFDEFKEIALRIAPSWTDSELNSCLSSIKSRTEETQKGKRTSGGRLLLYSLSDSYIQDKLEITSDELQIVDINGKPLVREILGEAERNRRDPERLDRMAAEHRARTEKARREAGMQSMDAYNSQRAQSKQELATLVKSMLSEGMKGKDVAAKLGITPVYVSQLKKLN